MPPIRWSREPLWQSEFTMKRVKRILTFLIAGTLLPLCVGCLDEDSQSEKIYPASDPSNTGDWVLNEEMSDEFEGERGP